jgi:excisionase family DNA binding protein
MSEEYLTATEAAAKLSVSKRTIQRYCRQGRLNYKWVQGKRHKELRIIPPIPVGELPGVHHKREIDTSDLVTRSDYDTTIVELRQRLLDQERRIEDLEREVARLAAVREGASFAAGTTAPSPVDGELRVKIESLINDFETVRPLEKQLVLKVAREVKEHEEALNRLERGDTETPPSR